MGIARACGVAGYTVDDPQLVPVVLSEAFHYMGPALVQAVVDPNEPPCRAKSPRTKPGNLRGQNDRWDMMKTVIENKIREVV